MDAVGRSGTMPTMEPAGLSDAQLLAEARGGGRQAWRSLCERHLPAVGAYLGARIQRPDLVDHLLEDLLVEAWRHLDEVEPAGDVQAWLRRRAAGLAKAWQRDHPGASLRGSLPLERCADAKLAERLRQIDADLAELPEAQRRILEEVFRGGREGRALEESVHSRPGTALALVEDALAALARRRSSRGSSDTPAGTGEPDL